MAVPQILASSSLQDSTTVTSRNLSIPSGVVTGSLLVAMCSVSGSSTPTVPTGWKNEGGAIATNHRHFFFTKYYDGTEGSSVTISTTNASKGNYLMLRFDINTVLMYVDSLNGTTNVNQNYRIHYPPSPSGSSYDYLALNIVGTRGVDTWQTSSNSTGSIFLNHGDTTGTVLWAQYRELPGFVTTYQPNNMSNGTSGWPFMSKHIGVRYADAGTELMTYNTTDNRGNTNNFVTMSVAGATRALAQSFQSNGKPISTVWFTVNRISGTAISGSLTCSIWENSGSAGYTGSNAWPSGSRLASSSANYIRLQGINTDAGSWEDYGFTFNDFATTSGSNYWVGLETPSITGGTGILQVMSGGTSHVGRLAILSASVWTNVNDDLRFTIFSKMDVIASTNRLGGARRNFMVS